MKRWDRKPDEKRWDRMTDEEKAERLAELQEKWPSMRNDHPRQEGLPHYNSWKKLDLEHFILCMDKSLLMSWLEYKREYANKRFEEYAEDINNFLNKGYRETHPEAAEVISDMVNNPRMDFEKTQKFVYHILKNFRPRGWPIRRGMDEDYYKFKKAGEEE